MATQKQSLPSFASIISVLSIVFYCLGFLRVELVLNEQKKRINALENVAGSKPSEVPDVMKLIMNAPESQSYMFHRNKRQADLTRNTTQAKHTADTMLKINKLLSEGRLQLCQSKGKTCSSGTPGPPGPPGPRGQKGARGRRGHKGRTGNKGDKGIMGLLGRSGEQGMRGPVGRQGETGSKGQKGDTGPAGMSGAKGEPGESISAPIVAVVPSKLTVSERGTALFQCSVSGNPEPAITWSKLDNKSEMSQSVVSGGKLVLQNVTRSDSGVYKCYATNILGQAQALVRLEVNGGLDESNILGSLNRKYLDKLKSYLRPVLRSSSRSSFLRCWQAKTDGWAGSTFHSQCDNKGPTVTIIKVNNYIFGGYTDASWSSPGSCSRASSSKSFIYSLYNINGYAPVKLQIKSGFKQHAIYRCPSFGPLFGGGNDIRISNNAASNTQSYTSCGHTYPLPPGYSSSGYSCRFYTGRFSFTPTDVEVFYETTT